MKTSRYKSSRICKLDGCGREHYGHDLCAMHYQRESKAGRLPKREWDPVKRFWSKVNKTEECWLWTAGKTKMGYGQFQANSVQQMAHRYAYQLAYGPIKRGHVIDHICRTPACVRPSHLRSATVSQNQQHRDVHQQRPTKSGVQNVYWKADRQRWYVMVKLDGRIHSGGEFERKADAVEAAKALRLRLFTHNDLDRHDPAA